mgnify:CR=1 FL=1
MGGDLELDPIPMSYLMALEGKTLWGGAGTRRKNSIKY